MDKNRLTAAGILAGIVFGAGFVSLLLIPGLGGTSKTTNFTDFYNSSGHRGTAAILAFVLLVGSWLMIWFFTELRGQAAGSVRSDVAYRLRVVGAAAVIVGTAIELGPLMVQNNSDNASFVGIPVAHTFAQAGFGAAASGMVSFALAVFLYGLEFRRAAAMPAWLGVVSLVIAVLLVPGSFFGIGAFLLPVWTIVVGVVARRAPGTRRLETPPPLRTS